MTVELKSAPEIDRMRRAGRVVAEILDALEAAVAPGVSTWELDQLAERLIKEKGAKSAFKGYRGFPAVLCASINHEVVHGIPSKSRKLVEGDLMKLDFGVSVEGFYGDAARTVPVGKVSDEARRLSEATRASLEAAIEVIRPGNRIGDIGHAVQAHVERLGFSVVRDFVGHGIGRKLHEDPQVPNYRTGARGVRLSEGLVLAIEPMVNAGRPEVYVKDDGWTAVTRDGQLSAHFEHSVAVTADGPYILSRA